jgi:hypothetical protein
MMYQIVESSSREDLEEAMRIWMKRKWQPLGGVAVVQPLENARQDLSKSTRTLSAVKLLYVQAIILHDD